MHGSREGCNSQVACWQAPGPGLDGAVIGAVYIFSHLGILPGAELAECQSCLHLFTVYGPSNVCCLC